MTSEENSNECPICWNVFNKTTSLSCSHKFCYDCICKHCLMNGASCPFCRQVIRSFSPYRKLSTSNTMNEKITTFTCRIKLGLDTHAGVVFRNKNTNEISQNGVIVSSLKKENAFVQFMKVGDVIISINGIPVKDHVQAAKIVTEITQNNECVVLQIERKRQFYKFWKQFRKKKIAYAESAQNT